MATENSRTASLIEAEIDRTIDLELIGQTPHLDGTPPVFELNARYYVQPGAKASDVSFDAACIHEGLEEILQTVLARIDDHEGDESFTKQMSALVFSALYLARLASGMSNAASAISSRESRLLEATPK